MGRTFKASANVKQPDFTIDGGGYGDYQPFSEHFVCRGSIPAGIILRFGEMSSMDLGEEIAPETVLANGTSLLTLVKDFFEAALTGKDRERFFALLNDKDKPVPFQLMLDVMNYLAEEFTERPTGGPSPTSQPATVSGPDLTAGRLPEVSTFSRTKRTPAGVLA